jgi:hypothetical protein
MVGSLDYLTGGAGNADKSKLLQKRVVRLAEGLGCRNLLGGGGHS